MLQVRARNLEETSVEGKANEPSFFDQHAAEDDHAEA